MKLEVSQKAKDHLDNNNFDKENKFLLINMVKYDCNGATLSMKVTKETDDEKNLYVLDGYKFIMGKKESELFNVISVDYIESGLSQGFSVKSESNLLGQCFVADLA